jgi:chromosome segregation ATPase
MPSNTRATAPDPEQVAARERLDSLYANIAIAEKQLADYEDLSEKIKVLKKSKEGLDDNIKDLQVKITELQKALHQAQVENSAFVSSADNQKLALAEEIKEKQEKFKNLSVELSDIKDQIRISTNELEELNKQYLNDKKHFAEGINNLVEEQAKIQTENRLLESKLIDLNNEVACLNQEINVAKASNNNLEAEKKNIESEIIIAQGNLKKLIVEEKKQIESNEAMLEKALAEKAEIEITLANREKALDEKEKDLIVREKFTKKSIDKLHTYKTQMEEKYGERFPDLKI